VQAGDIVDDRWRIADEAGHGGMGTVYRALDLATGEVVAIKILRRTESLDDEIASGRFEREIEVLQALIDPRIVRYIAHGTTEDQRPYLVEEWIDGRSLASLLAAEGLTIGDSARVIAQVAAALADAHSHGIVHRDLKPDNLLFVDGDLAQLKVIDFGIARRGGDARRLTRTGTFVGTPGYVAPEQARGSAQVDARCDVFALGCILYECLTGRPAFAGRGVTAMRAKVLLFDPPPAAEVIADVPPALSDLVTRMLAKAPAERPADGAEVAALLAPFMSLTGGRRGARAITDAPEHTDITDIETVASVDTRHGAHLACLVLAESDRAGVDERDQLARLRTAVAAHGGRLEVLGGGTVVVTAPPMLLPTEQLVRAAHCALALRPLVPGPVLLCGAAAHDTDTAETLSRAIDDGIETLLRTSGRRDLPVDAVQIERGFASALREAGFDVEHDPLGAAYLRTTG